MAGLKEEIARTFPQGRLCCGCVRTECGFDFAVSNICSEQYAFADQVIYLLKGKLEKLTVIGDEEALNWREYELGKLKAECQELRCQSREWGLAKGRAECQARVERVLETIDNALCHWDSFSPLCSQQMVAMATSEWLKMKQELKENVK